MIDEKQKQKLSELYPPFSKIVENFINEAHRQKMKVGIFEGLRTYERQQELYLRGRNLDGTIKDRTQIVTNAKPGLSYHNYGLAIDLVFDANEVKPGWQWSWSDKYPWKDLAVLGRSLGLESAYFWTRFPECPHFQLSYGFKVRELLKVLLQSGLSGVWSMIDGSSKIS